MKSRTGMNDEKKLKREWMMINAEEGINDEKI